MRSPAAHADMRLTYDDFVLFPDDGKRHEIIDGEHYVTPSPNVRHQRLVGRLLYEIELYLRANPRAGEVSSAPLDVVLSRFDIVEPDLLFVAGDQTDILTEKNIQGAPALVVEVLSKSTRKRDAQTKRRLRAERRARGRLPDRPARTVP
ncbi:MAG: Uma2 family endonuclease [Vicinamibacterales bacterium]